ncbi:MAG TPA: DUF3015 domain-containing protein [Gammaproteobacteria bacterium]|nr:DUF3015 domain-containing protein [Gammaproteobacteria bacterium]
MKRIILAATLTLLGMASTAYGDSGPGCGWGTTIFKGQSGLFAHTMAATTNGTSWNQWFGLTSGTAGCDPDTVVSNEFQKKLFVASNMDLLSQDMAQGRGDHLDALATLMNISEEDKAGFFSLTQSQLATLLDAASKGAPEMLSALDKAMRAHPELAKYAR